MLNLKSNVMEVKELVKSIVSKKVDNMSLDELIKFVYGEGTQYVIVESEAVKVREAFKSFIDKMTKEELRVALSKSWWGADGCAEDVWGKLSLCGVGGEIGHLIFSTGFDNVEGVQNDLKITSRYKMEREYMEKVENKLEGILNAL